MIVQGDGKSQLMSVGTKVVQVKPGMGAGTVLTFPGEGHQRPNQRQSDLVINLA